MSGNRKNRGMLLSVLAIVLLNTGAIVSAHGTEEHARDSRVPLPRHNTTKGEKCVEPTDIMRKQHMEFILHQRDETVHRGIRTNKHSLQNCVNCHADPETKSVLGKDGFCASCHSYAAVSMDCFSCHTDKASDKKAVRSGVGALGNKIIVITGGSQ